MAKLSDKLNKLKKGFKSVLKPGKKGFYLTDKSLDVLKQEREEIKQRMSLKRDRRREMLDKREGLFNDIINSEDDFLKRELAEEIFSIEDEIKAIQDEYSVLIDSLRIMDTLIHIKRKEEFLENKGILEELQNMEHSDLVKTIKRSDVRKMIEEEEWDTLSSFLEGHILVEEDRDERVEEILRKAEEK